MYKRVGKLFAKLSAINRQTCTLLANSIISYSYWALFSLNSNVQQLIQYTQIDVTIYTWKPWMIYQKYRELRPPGTPEGFWRPSTRISPNPTHCDLVETLMKAFYLFCWIQFQPSKRCILLTALNTSKTKTSQMIALVFSRCLALSPGVTPPSDFSVIFRRSLSLRCNDICAMIFSV